MTINKSNQRLVMQAAALWQRTVYKSDYSTLPNSSMFEFAKFLGDPYDGKRDFIVNIDNPEVVEKLQKIVGPHGHAILKMIQAQQNGD